MTDSKQLEQAFPLNIDGLVKHYEMTLQREGFLEDSPFIINQLLEKLGWKVPRLKRKVHVYIELTGDIKKHLKEKESCLAQKLARGSKIKSMDCSAAKYIIEATLSSFECRIANRRLNKKEADEFLCYSSRTMRDQQRIYKDRILNPKTFEHQIFTELRRELKSLTAQD